MLRVDEAAETVAQMAAIPCLRDGFALFELATGEALAWLDVDEFDGRWTHLQVRVPQEPSDARENVLVALSEQMGEARRMIKSIENWFIEGWSGEGRVEAAQKHLDHVAQLQAIAAA
jgi:hypothetical protein